MKGKPSQDELWELYETAYRQFHTEFMAGLKTYHRYVMDFVSYNLLIDSTDIESWKQHVMNLYCIFDLLTERKDIVLRHFAQDGLQRADFEMIHREFNTTEADSAEVSPSCASYPAVSVLSRFSDSQMSLIVAAVNESRLFVREVTLEDMERFFSCSLNRPLQVANNGLVALFLDCLRSEYLISHKWQKLIADHGMLCSFRNQKVLTRTDISTSLSAYRSHHPQRLKEFASIANQLKEMTEKEE